MSRAAVGRRITHFAPALAATALALGFLTAAGPSDGSPPTAQAAGRAADDRGAEHHGNYDARILHGDALAHAQVRQVRANGKAVHRLAVGLGGGARIEVDPLTGTPDSVSATGRTLTGPSKAAPTKIALGYVRDHAAAFGLTSADLSTLVLARRYTDVNKITHLYWQQRVQGIPVFGNGLRAHVTADGRLLSVQGAPVSGLSRLASNAPDARISSSTAIGRAVSDAHSARPAVQPGSTAQRVWFLTAEGLRPAWTTYTEPDTVGAYAHVIDARTGAVLYRQSLTDYEGKNDPSGDAYVHDNYPGASGDDSGGKIHHVNLIKLGFLDPHATYPWGPFATVWPDVNDNNKRDVPAEVTHVPTSLKQAKAWKLKPFKTAKGQIPCSKHYMCTWNPKKAKSWKVNMNQDALEGLYLSGRYATWLEKAPFGFTKASGNFTRGDGDAIKLNVLDGANTAGGFPDGDHVNNANFSTPQDGKAPKMQMYLNDDFYLAASSTDDFLTLGHEFTHGLSNRLVVNSDNKSTLHSYQAGGMGEGWSDFYAFDYVLTHHYAKNDPAVPGELSLDLYLAKNEVVTRTEAIDCGVGDDVPRCDFGDQVGGYTYDAVGDGALGTEVHDVGEAWAQTLFDIWQDLGHEKTMGLVTEGMRLTADDPSLVDARDGILAADEAMYGGADTDALWSHFAARGLGYYAGSDGGSDPAPTADFHVPPADTSQKGSISGTATDTEGNPLSGVSVHISGHPEWSAVTDDNGHYTINDVVVGTWPKVTASRAGYESDVDAVTVVANTTATYNPELRRDWASASGGASIADFNGPDYSPQCGPEGAIDLSAGTGWGSATQNSQQPLGPDGESKVKPRFIVIDLPSTIDVTGFGVNPTATCGDPGSASTGEYKIYVAATPDGPWGSPVASGTFDENDRNKLVDIPLGSPATGVGAIKYVMVKPQVPDWSGCPTAYAGCQFIDTTEVAAYND
ncbi:M36 family metallopeptidase [Nocardioides panacisoli]|uniref:FTP domain-containing protein n=1 Tax=Nocardioides panacisoli TaxID=627624 RepID=A0ABP7IGB0_9ACTN